MPRNTVAAVRETSTMAPPVTVIAALAVELACLGTPRPGAEHAPVRRALSGPGAARARAAATTAIRGGASGLVSWGLAGGLDPALVPGTVIVPKRIVTTAREPALADAEWHAGLVALLGAAFPLHCGDLASVDEVLVTPRSKARIAAELDAVAVDMESFAIATAAAEAGLPVVVVRVVADALGDALPADVEKWIDDRGRRRIAPVFSTLTAPAQWPVLLRLAARYRTASRRLRALAEILEPRAFGFPPGAGVPTGV